SIPSTSENHGGGTLSAQTLSRTRCSVNWRNDPEIKTTPSSTCRARLCCSNTCFGCSKTPILNLSHWRSSSSFTLV
ncbi:hypothetical protein Gotri_020044, partial [Gossypium trilobum]|nr:hypothetical protein [Gossypium trilobum]